MYCKDVNECFEQISAYCDGERTGYPLLVNTESFDVYQDILQRLEADTSKQCIYVSNTCQQNGLPNTDECISNIVFNENYALIGLSQALMLQSESVLEKNIDILLGLSISGYAVVLLDHCAQYLQKFMNRDIRVQNRVIIVDGIQSELPKIRIVKNMELCVGFKPQPSIGKLLSYLEHLSNAQLERQPELTVVTPFNSSLFSHAIYSVTPAAGIYEALTKQYADVSGATYKTYATDAQWCWLAEKLKSANSLSAVVCDAFGTTSNLSAHLSDVMGKSDKNEKWLLWLALKVFGEKSNKYLNMVFEHSISVEDFEEHLYLDLADISCQEDFFVQYYTERKRLLDRLPENLPLINKYCDRVGKHEKNAVFYLTDSSENEKFEFVRCLSIYDYSAEQLDLATKTMSRALVQYMQPFIFDQVNTKVSDVDVALRNTLTQYFQTYKVQKLTNRIFPDFLVQVNEFAKTRPYNKLRPRSSIVSQMDRKNAQLFFFDALGVEYLAYIQAKCEEYGLIMEVSIGHCELPSITVKNKEFLQYFIDDRWRKIDALDEIKHHSQEFDYQKCKEPLYLFTELEVIDSALRKIQSQLSQGIFERAIIVSDHGASRLAVIYGHEDQSPIQLDEKGEHSGRCCPVKTDPMIPFAAYEDGFAVLANYNRFKGGRKANVEVHGGASLEEVVVPIITLSKKPENIEICFTDPVVILRQREQATITLYSNVPLQHPRLLVNGVFYNGEFVADKKHARFVMPRLKRSKEYSADIYDGNKNMAVTLKFKIQKATGREVDLF